MFANGRRMYFECVEPGRKLLLSMRLQYNFLSIAIQLDTSHFFPLSSSQRSFLVLLDTRTVHINPIKRDLKSLLMIRNRKEMQQLKESNKFYRVSLFPGMKGTEEWEGERGREWENDSETEKREREKGRVKKKKKQKKSAYTPVNYCLACLTRFMRVRSVSITGLKELKTTLRRKQ